MLFYYLDANALAKAYVNEKGSDAVNLLFGIHTINPELDSLEKIEKLIQPIESGNIN